MIKILSLLTVIACLGMVSCDTLKDPNSAASFAVSAGTDVGLAYVLTKHPEHAAYADLLSEAVAVRDVSPDKLEAALTLIVETQVEPEDQIGMRAVANAIARQYRRYYDREKIELPVETYQDALVAQLTDSQEGGSK